MLGVDLVVPEITYLKENAAKIKSKPPVLQIIHSLLMHHVLEYVLLVPR